MMILGDGAIDLSLTNTGVSAPSYGNAPAVATFTVDAQGRLTAAGPTDISITGSQVSDLESVVEGFPVLLTVVDLSVKVMEVELTLTRVLQQKKFKTL